MGVDIGSQRKFRIS